MRIRTLHPASRKTTTFDSGSDHIFAASDGDQFPYLMQRLHLATIVGERTWGRVAVIASP